MKLSTRLFSLLLALVMMLALTSCTPSSDAEVTPSPTPSTGTGDEYVADTSVEDLCLAITGLPSDFELFTVNGRSVTALFYLYWVGYGISYFDSMGVTLDFSGDPELCQYLKDDSLNAATQYILVAEKAKEHNLSLTQKQIDELDKNIASVKTTLGGEEAFQRELFRSCLDYESFYFINSCPYYYTLLEDALFADRPNDDDLATFIADNDILSAKHILLMTVDADTREPLDEATVAGKKASAEGILAELQSSTDLETDFDRLMNEHSEDTGLTYYPDGYIFTAGEMVSEFEEATRALEYGEISGLVESSFGYHIILRQAPDNEEIRAEARASLLNAQMDAWFSEAVTVTTEEYEQLDMTVCYQRYMAYQAAFEAERAAEKEAAEGETAD